MVVVLLECYFEYSKRQPFLFKLESVAALRTIAIAIAIALEIFPELLFKTQYKHATRNLAWKIEME